MSIIVIITIIDFLLLGFLEFPPLVLKTLPETAEPPHQCHKRDSFVKWKKFRNEWEVVLAVG